MTNKKEKKHIEESVKERDKEERGMRRRREGGKGDREKWLLLAGTFKRVSPSLNSGE